MKKIVSLNKETVGNAVTFWSNLPYDSVFKRLVDALDLPGGAKPRIPNSPQFILDQTPNSIIWGINRLRIYLSKTFLHGDKETRIGLGVSHGLYDSYRPEYNDLTERVENALLAPQNRTKGK